MRFMSHRFGGVSLKISMPEEMCNEAVRKGLSELGYRLVRRQNGWVTFEGVFSIRTTADRVGIGLREFARFCRTIRVEGGRKIRRKGALIIEPVRKRKLKVRLSGDEYDALTKVAKDRGYTRNISSFFRDSLISSLMIRMEWRGAI